MDIYWKKAPGLNVEGLCRNRHCLGHGSQMTANLGFGEFDLSRISLQAFVPCPLCQQKIEPIRYGFTQCTWRKIDHYTMIDYPLHDVKDEYISFRLHSFYEIIEVMAPFTDHENDTKLDIIDTLQSTHSENEYVLEPSQSST